MSAEEQRAREDELVARVLASFADTPDDRVRELLVKQSQRAFLRCESAAANERRRQADHAMLQRLIQIEAARVVARLHADGPKGGAGPQLFVGVAQVEIGPR